jgi:hypothetical protein
MRMKRLLIKTKLPTKTMRTMKTAPQNITFHVAEEVDSSSIVEEDYNPSTTEQLDRIEEE